MDTQYRRDVAALDIPVRQRAALVWLTSIS